MSKSKTNTATGKVKMPRFLSMNYPSIFLKNAERPLRKVITAAKKYTHAKAPCR